MKKDKDKKHKVKVLCRKIKDPKHKTKVLPKPNVQKLIPYIKSPTKAWGITFKLHQINALPHPPSHMEKEGGAKMGFKEQN
jgi:hypothetical protein